MPENPQTPQTPQLTIEQGEQLAAKLSQVRDQFNNNRNRRRQIEQQALATHIQSGGTEWDFKPLQAGMLADQVANYEFPIVPSEVNAAMAFGYIEPPSQKAQVLNAPVSTSNAAYAISRVASGGLNSLWESGEEKPVNWFDKVSYGVLEKGIVGGSIQTVVGAANTLGILATNNPLHTAIASVQGIDPQAASELRVQTMNWIDHVMEDISPRAAGQRYDPNTMEVRMGTDRKVNYVFDTNDPDKSPGGFFSVDGMSEVVGNVGSMFITAGLAGKAFGGLGAATKGMLSTQRTVGSLFALSEAGQFERQTYQLAKDKGYSDQAARTMSEGLSVAFLPFSYYIESTFEPGTRMAAGTFRGETIYGKVVTAAIGNAIEEGSSAEVQGLMQLGANLLQPTQNPDGTTTHPFWQVQLNALSAAGVGAFSGVWFGGIDGVLHPQSRESFNEYNNKLHELMVGVLRQGARSTLQNEIMSATGFNMKGNDVRQGLMVVDRFVQAYANKKNISTDEALSQILVNLRERAMSGQTPDFVLYSSTDEAFQSHSRLEDILTSEEMVRSFGKKKADPEALFKYLKSKGAKDLELETVLGPMMAQARARNQGSTQGQEPVKYSIEDLLQASRQRRIRVSKLVLQTKDQKTYQDLIDQSSEIQAEIIKLRSEPPDPMTKRRIEDLGDLFGRISRDLQTIQNQSKARFPQARLRNPAPVNRHDYREPRPYGPMTKNDQLQFDTYEEILINLDALQQQEFGLDTSDESLHFQGRLSGTDTVAAASNIQFNALDVPSAIAQVERRTGKDIEPAIRDKAIEIGRKAEQAATAARRGVEDKPVEYNLVHARVYQTILPDGRRAMYINELQSDVAQSLRDDTERKTREAKQAGGKYDKPTDSPTFSDDTTQWMSLGIKTLITHAMSLGIDTIVFPNAWQEYSIQGYNVEHSPGDPPSTYRNEAAYNEYVTARNEYKQLEKDLLGAADYPDQDKLNEKRVQVRLRESEVVGDLREKKIELQKRQQELTYPDWTSETTVQERRAVLNEYNKAHDNLTEQINKLNTEISAKLRDDDVLDKLDRELAGMMSRNASAKSALKTAWSRVEKLKRDAGRYFSHKALYEEVLIKVVKDVLKQVGIKQPTIEAVQLPSSMTPEVYNHRQLNPTDLPEETQAELRRLQRDFDHFDQHAHAVTVQVDQIEGLRSVDSNKRSAVSIALENLGRYRHDFIDEVMSRTPVSSRDVANKFFDAMDDHPSDQTYPIGKIREMLGITQEMVDKQEIPEPIANFIGALALSTKDRRDLVQRNIHQKIFDLHPVVVDTVKQETSLSLKLSPEDQAKILERGFPLYSAHRAAFVWYNQLGKGKIVGTPQATFEDFLHEVFHMARRSLIDGPDLAKLESIMGVQNGKWTVEQEERFVSVMKTWLLGTSYDRAAVSADMAGLLATMRDAIKDRFQAIDHAGFGGKLPEELHGILRRIFVEDSGPIAKMESDIVLITQKIPYYEQFLDSISTTQQQSAGQGKTRDVRVPLKGEEAMFEATKVKIANLKNQLKSTKEKLRTTLEQTFEPNQKTHQELLADEAIVRQIESFKNMPNDEIAKLYEGRTMKDLRSWFGSVANKVLDTPMGRILVDQLDQMEDFADNWAGPYYRAIAGVFRQTAGSKKAIGQVVRNENEEVGFSKLYQHMEPDTVPDHLKTDTTSLEGENGFGSVKQMIETLFFSQNQFMKALNMYRRMPSGDILPTVPTEELKLPRLMTPEAFTLKDHDLYKLGTLVLKLNGIEPNDTNIQGFVRDYKDSIERRGGFLEGSRSLKYMPHEFKSVSGEWVQIFHSDPIEVISTWARRMAQRYAKIQFAGQSLLHDVSDNQYLMMKTLQLFGEDPKKITRTMLIDRAVNLVGYAIVNGNTVPLTRDMANAMTNKELLAVLAAGQIPSRHDPAALLGMIHNLRPQDLFKTIKAKPGTKDYNEIAAKRLEAFRDLAKKIGGIDSTLVDKGHQGMVAVLAGMQRRFGAKIEDFVMDKLLAQHVRAGGDGEAFKWLLQRYQGVPIRTMSEHWWSRWMDFEKNITNTLMTSLAPVKGVFQFVSTAIKDHNDIINSIGLMWKMAADPAKYREMRDFAIEIGAMKPLLNTWGADMTSQLQRVGRMISQGSTNVIQGRVAELQNIISVGLAQKRIQKWNLQKGKLSEYNKSIARSSYRLSEEEIGLIEKLGFVPESVANKAMRNAVRTEQFVTEAAHRRALVELDPLPGWFFGRFQGFAIGMGRRTAETIKEIRDATVAAQGNRSKLTAWAMTPRGRAATTRLLAIMLAALGGSLLQKIASNAVKGLPPVPDDEDYWDTVTGALWEAQVMGYATTAISPFGFHNKTEEALVALAPGITFIAGLGNAVLGWGRTGDFPLISDTGFKDSRPYQFIKSVAPALQAADRQWEYFAYPRRREHDETRAKYFRWAAKQPWYDKNVDFDNPINAEKYVVFKELARGNMSAAGRMAQRYYQNRRADMKSGKMDNPETLISGLRSSLINKAPIPVGEDSPRRGKFLQSLSPHDRQKALMADFRYRANVELVAPTED